MSHKSISRIFFLAKFHFLQFQKWPKINFWTGKIFKTAKNAILRKKIWLVWFHEFFCLDFFTFSGPPWIYYLARLSIKYHQICFSAIQRIQMPLNNVVGENIMDGGHQSKKKWTLMLLEMIIILKIFPLDPPDFWERNPDFKFPSCHHFLWNKRVRLSHSDIKSEQSAIWESRTICHCCQNPVQKEYSKTGFFSLFG